ncbi:MAG TPA: class I adenylate-forming enzyme family protein, partial [Burkholderiales bacterium]|nr:class I adenylate-forming enzyme family protein [Burkholderiales bacterium]
MRDLIFPNETTEPFDAALQRSAALAERLAREAGLGPGERLVLALENSRAHVDLVLAAWRLGAQLIAVPPTASGPTFAGILESGAPRVVAVESKNERLARIVDDWARTIQGLQGTPGGGIVLGLAGAAPQASPTVRPDTLAVSWQEWLAHLPPAVFYTSGSTSTAKGVPLHWARILAKGRAVLGHYGVTAQDRVMPILPLSHVYGLYCLLGTIDLGADAILCSESGTPAALAAGLAEHGASVAVCPPIVGAFLFGRHGCAPAIREPLRVLSMGG